MRRGFTLLEVLLTLSLAVVLMSLVGGALQFYARDMNIRDLDIRQTQLAASVMQMIEDDLRATLHTEPVDTAPLAELLAATATATGGGGDPAAAAAGAAGGEDLSAAGLDSGSSTDTTSMEDTSTLDLQSGVAVLQTPGLIGNQFQVQIDLSRLPRLEDYVSLLDGTNADIDDVPSDIKTVAYYVQDAGTLGGVQDPLDALTPDTASDQPAGGLVRRSLDRQATMYAANNGNLTTLNQTGELLAPEVQGIEFQYWDGLTWQLEWSSDEYEELPLAVMITLYMVDPRVEPDPTTATTMRTFRHIVRLPMARIIQEEEEDISGTGI